MTTTQRDRWMQWLHATAVRCVRVGAAAAVATIGASTFFHEVHWDVVAGVAILAMIVEALICLASLPEAPPPINLWRDEEMTTTEPEPEVEPVPEPEPEEEPGDEEPPHPQAGQAQWWVPALLFVIGFLLGALCYANDIIVGPG